MLQLRNRLGLHSFCLYHVFGPYDCLLRIWLNPVAYERLKDLMHQSHDIETEVDFVVNEHQHWAFPRSEETDQKVQLALAKHAPQMFHRAQRGDRAVITQLREDALLLEEQTWFPDQIKFYLAISELAPMLASNRGMVREGIRAVLARFSSEQNGRDRLHHISSCIGRGFAFAMVKGVAPSIPVLMQFSEALRLQLSPFALLTTTFIIGSAATTESEWIQAGSMAEEHRFNSSIKAWIPELYAPGGPRMSTIRASEVDHYLASHELFADLDFKSRLWIGKLVVALARETISQDTGAAVASDILSSWFRGLEQWLRSRLEDFILCRAERKNDRFVELQRASELPRNTQYTALGDVLKGVIRVLEASGDREFPLKRHESLINQIAELRNDVQHGDTGYLVRWRETLDLVARFIPLEEALRSRVQEAVGQKQTVDDGAVVRRSAESPADSEHS